MTPQQYCRDKVAPRGSSLHYAFLYLDETQRSDLCALHALRAEIMEAAAGQAESGVTSAKLEWWRGELERLLVDEAQHPAAQAVAAARRRHHLPGEQLRELVDGAAMTIGHDGFESYKDQALYAYRTSSIVELMSLEILGYTDRHSLKCAHELGIALELMRIVSEIGHDLRQGRNLLPHDELAQHGIDLYEIVTTPPPTAFAELVREQLARANDYTARGLGLLPEVDRSSFMPALIRVGIAEATLREIERSRFDVLRQRIDLPPLRKLWIAWRTRARVRGRKPLA